MEIIIKCSDDVRGSKNIYDEPIQEVVRCKDCKFRYGEKKGFCYGIERYMTDMDFCSRGERREDETD